MKLLWLILIIIAVIFFIWFFNRKNKNKLAAKDNIFLTECENNCGLDFKEGSAEYEFCIENCKGQPPIIIN